jgi:hypothetical protein
MTKTTTFTTRKAPTIDQRAAYLRGWNASKRTTTANLEAAEARFVAKHGAAMHSEFVAGWTDYAADHEKFHSAPEFHPVFAASQLAYEDAAEAESLWRDGYRPIQAEDLRANMAVAYRATDVFGCRTVGAVKFARVSQVHHVIGLYDQSEYIDEVQVEHSGGTTECDPEDEVWARVDDVDAWPTKVHRIVPIKARIGEPVDARRA